MLQLLLRPVLLLVLLCMVPITLIRAQLYDDSELRTFMTVSEDCPAPCFMDIRPGVTTKEEAIAILEENAWVTDLNVQQPINRSRDQITSISWAWTEAAPEFVRSQLGGSVGISQGVVEYIQFFAPVSLGQLILSFGRPDESEMSIYRRSLVAVYDDNLHGLTLFVECPLSPDVATSILLRKSTDGRGRIIYAEYDPEHRGGNLYECMRS